MSFPLAPNLASTLEQQLALRLKEILPLTHVHFLKEPFLRPPIAPFTEPASTHPNTPFSSLALAFELPSDSQALRGGALELLSADEKRRYAGMTEPSKQDLFLFGRAALRTTLSSLLNRAPTALEISGNPGGKPHLENRELDFNLSHSHRWIAIGVSLDFSIGMDIEPLSPRPKALQIAQRFFPAAEADALARLSPEALDLGFLRVWTAKEALLKAVGGAIPTDLPRTFLQIGPNQEISPADSGTRLVEWNPVPSLVGHIALCPFSLATPA